MIYESTPRNIYKFMRNVGVARKEQILRFFSDERDAVRLEYYLEQMIKNRMLDYDERTEVFSWHRMVKVVEQEVKLRLKALWVVVAFKSSRVREIVLLNYPFQFLIITHDNLVYDISCCYETIDATLAMRTYNLNRIDGIEDEINHIAIVDSEELGNKIGTLGFFDSYCILDKNHKPKYSTWD